MVRDDARAARLLTMRRIESLALSWPGLSRPSTTWPLHSLEDVDARHKAGQDGERIAIAAHNAPPYQAALKALGDGAVRDIRIIEGLE